MPMAFEDSSVAGTHAQEPPPMGVAGWLLLLVLAAVQFTHIMDFIILMPLAPSLTKQLDINPQQFAFLISAYAFAAFLSGLVAARYIDRFDRKRALLFLYGGFTVGTLLCAVPGNFLTLLLARVVAGAFGGVLGGISLAVIGDTFHEKRRGLATGVVMSSFSLATVAGVPAGLWIAEVFGTADGPSNGAPFAVLGLLSIAMLVLAVFALPPQRRHLNPDAAHVRLPILQVLVIPAHVRAYLVMSCLVLSTFMVIPFISLYMVNNTGYPQADLKLIYLAGGAATLFTMPIFGRVSDRFGKLPVSRILLVLAVVPILLLTNFETILRLVHADPGLAGIKLPILGTEVTPRMGLVIGVTTLFMIFTSGRMVPAMALITSSAAPSYRGSFMSIVSSVQQLASGVASVVAGVLVTQVTPESPIVGFPLVGLLGCIGSAAAFVLIGGLIPRLSEKPLTVTEEVAEAMAPETGMAIDSAEEGVALPGGIQ